MAALVIGKVQHATEIPYNHRAEVHFRRLWEAETHFLEASLAEHTGMRSTPVKVGNPLKHAKQSSRLVVGPDQLDMAHAKRLGEFV